MKKAIIYIIILTLGVHFDAMAANNLPASSALLIGSNVELKQDLTDFIGQLQSKRKKNQDDKKFARYVFFKTHKIFLKRYEQQVKFDELAESGKYDCLTGTALYAIIFDALGFNYEIHETPYHVYLILKIETGDLLIESTNAINGFIDSELEIQQALNEYLADASEPSVIEYDSKDKVIDLKQLVGLQDYNISVRFYNERNFEQAIIYYNRALGHYYSQRMESYYMLLQQAYVSAMQDKLKNQQLSALR